MKAGFCAPATLHSTLGPNGVSQRFLGIDKIRNPFSPGAGSPPPELAGREAILEQARVLFGRVLAKRPEKSLLPLQPKLYRLIAPYTLLAV